MFLFSIQGRTEETKKTVPFLLSAQLLRYCLLNEKSERSLCTRARYGVEKIKNNRFPEWNRTYNNRVYSLRLSLSNLIYNSTYAKN